MKTTIKLYFLLQCFWSFAQYTTVPDAYFEQWLIGHGIDSEGVQDGRVLTSDMETIEYMYLINVSFIYDITGIEACTNLKWFELSHGKITAGLNFENATLLEHLDLSRDTQGIDGDGTNTGAPTTVHYLDLSHNPNLNYFRAVQVGLDSIHFGTNTNLKYIDVSANDIRSIDVSELPNLETLYISNIGLYTTLDISNNTALKHLDTFFYEGLAPYSNQIQNIDFTHNPNLEVLRIMFRFYENIIDVDLSQNPVLRSVSLWANADYVNIANGNNANMGFDFHRGAYSTCIQVDTQEIADAANADLNSWTETDDVTYGIAPNCATASVAENAIANISVLPNPSTGIFTLSMDGSELKEIVCFNALGQKIAVFNTNTIDLTKVKKGSYFIKITTNDGKIITKQLMKK